MKNRPILVAGITLIMFFGGSASVAAETLQRDAALHVLPLRLAEPQWRPLTAQEIKSRISGRTVVIDETYEPAPGVKVNVSFPGGCPPSETFFPDGRWEMGMCERLYRTFKGRWYTEAFRGGGRLCTEANDHAKECRFVWQGSTADQIIMSQPSIAGANEPTDDFNPYRVTPRKE
jgi:hypothetical protein